MFLRFFLLIVILTSCTNNENTFFGGKILNPSSDKISLYKNYHIKIKDYKELDFLKKYIPPPNDIKTGNQAAKIGGNKPFTPNELNRNDIT